jgi:trehalose 6-phosphate phosphatase
MPRPWGCLPLAGRGPVREASVVDSLAQLTEQPGRAAIFLDVDGTLAPIVADPADSRVPEPTRTELERLAGRYALVACVSGRPGERAREIVGVPTLTYVGEHGLELDPEAARWAPRIHSFAAEAGWPAEDKPLSAAFHYRTAPDHDEARRVLQGIEQAARAQGFRTRWGRLVLEVLPPLETSKGTAVRRLLASNAAIRSALYAGDDTTDLDGFAALDGLDSSVRVAVSSPEGPTELAARADIVVESPEALAGVLARL